MMVVLATCYVYLCCKYKVTPLNVKRCTIQNNLDVTRVKSYNVARSSLAKVIVLSPVNESEKEKSLYLKGELGKIVKSNIRKEKCGKEVEIVKYSRRKNTYCFISISYHCFYRNYMLLIMCTYGISV